MSAPSQNVVAGPNHMRRRRTRAAAGLMAESVAGLVNLPGLRDTAQTAHDLITALKVSGLGKSAKSDRLM
jgi:hypothetical protein